MEIAPEERHVYSTIGQSGKRVPEERYNILFQCRPAGAPAVITIVFYRHGTPPGFNHTSLLANLYHLLNKNLANRVVLLLCNKNTTHNAKFN